MLSGIASGRACLPTLSSLEHGLYLAGHSRNGGLRRRRRRNRPMTFNNAFFSRDSVMNLYADTGATPAVNGRVA
jgi:hypothetical protein